MGQIGPVFDIAYIWLYIRTYDYISIHMIIYLDIFSNKLCQMFVFCVLMMQKTIKMSTRFVIPGRTTWCKLLQNVLAIFSNSCGALVYQEVEHLFTENFRCRLVFWNSPYMEGISEFSYFELLDQIFPIDLAEILYFGFFLNRQFYQYKYIKLEIE